MITISLQTFKFSYFHRLQPMLVIACIYMYIEYQYQWMESLLVKTRLLFPDFVCLLLSSEVPGNGQLPSAVISCLVFGLDIKHQPFSPKYK